MSASKLVKPAADYQSSFIEAMKEYQAEDRYKFIRLDAIQKDFAQFAADLSAGRTHMHKPYADWVEPVPETVLWLVKEDFYIGTVNLRHRLNWHLEKWGGHINFLVRPSMRRKGFGKKILQKAIPFASYLGIERALITIPPGNQAAIDTVEFCGAEFQDELSETHQFPARRRYWLNCL